MLVVSWVIFLLLVFLSIFLFWVLVFVSEISFCFLLLLRIFLMLWLWSVFVIFLLFVSFVSERFSDLRILRSVLWSLRLSVIIGSKLFLCKLVYSFNELFIGWLCKVKSCIFFYFVVFLFVDWWILLGFIFFKYVRDCFLVCKGDYMFMNLIIIVFI